jgi:hypothetical protein
MVQRRAVEAELNALATDQPTLPMIGAGAGCLGAGGTTPVNEWRTSDVLCVIVKWSVRILRPPTLQLGEDDVDNGGPAFDSKSAFVAARAGDVRCRRLGRRRVRRR